MIVATSCDRPHKKPSHAIIGVWHSENQGSPGNNDVNDENETRTCVYFFRSDGRWAELLVWGEPPVPAALAIGLAGEWKPTDQPTRFCQSDDDGSSWYVDVARIDDNHLVLRIEGEEQQIEFVRGAGPWEDTLDQELRLHPDIWKVCKEEPPPGPRWEDQVDGIVDTLP